MNKLICGQLLGFVIAASLGSLLATDATAQMEKRKNEHYHCKLFENSHPRVGEVAPELELVTLSGEKVRLSDYLGKQVVLIKGGYT